MIRNAKLNYAVRFANACKNANLNPMLTARLVELAIRASNAGVRNANGVDRNNSLDRTRNAVESAAAEQGLTVHWPGLYPEFTRVVDGRKESVSIPYPG